MFFANPTYLWAFLGLTIPIAIHLWSKREGKTIKVGSVQLLKKADTKQSSSIKLNEFWLLLLRLSLLSILVLIISGMHIKKKVSNSKITYIVEASLLENQAFAGILDSIATNSPIRLLAPDFPEVDLEESYNYATSVPNYWQLAAKMQTIPTDSIIVFSQGYLAGFKGIRPEIAEHIEWIPIATDSTAQVLLNANKINEQLELILLNSSSSQLALNKEVLPLSSPKLNVNPTKDSVFYNEQQVVINSEKTREILLYYSDSLMAQANYIEAGLNAVATYLNRDINLVKTINLDTVKDIDYDLIVWFSDILAPSTKGKLLLYKPNAFSNKLIQESNLKNTYHLTQNLNSEVVAADRLPEQLIALFDLNPGIQEKIAKNDLRILDKAAMVPAYGNKKLKSSSNNGINLASWLWGAFMLVLISERILASYRKQ